MGKFSDEPEVVTGTGKTSAEQRKIVACWENSQIQRKKTQYHPQKVSHKPEKITAEHHDPEKMADELGSIA